MISVKPCLSHIFRSMLLVTWVSLWRFLLLSLLCAIDESVSLYSLRKYSKLYIRTWFPLGKISSSKCIFVAGTFQPPQHKRKNVHTIVSRHRQQNQRGPMIRTNRTREWFSPSAEQHAIARLGPVMLACSKCRFPTSPTKRNEKSPIKCSMQAHISLRT